jgi:outer membrane receptor protein involved in Fe transport
LPNFQTVDVHVSRRIDISRGELEVYLDVINLTNRRNIGGYRYSAADQRRASKLLPLTPILGMLWRW